MIVLMRMGKASTPVYHEFARSTNGKMSAGPGIICQETTLQLPTIKSPLTDLQLTVRLRGRERRRPLVVSVPNRAGGSPAERPPGATSVASQGAAGMRFLAA